MSRALNMAAFVSSLGDLAGDWRWGEIFLELVAIAFVSLFTYGVLTAFNLFVERVYRGRGRWRTTVLRAAPLARFALFAVLAVTIGSILFGLSRPVLAVSIVAIAIALGLGSVGLMRNVLSGAIIGLQSPFAVNDRVRIGEVEGDILRIGIRSTALRSSDGSIVHVPNHRFVTDTVVNQSLDRVGSPTHILVPVPPDADLTSSKELAFRAACVSKFSSPCRRPQVRVVPGSDSDALALEILAYTFDARFEEQLRGEVVELLAANFRRATSPPQVE